MNAPLPKNHPQQDPTLWPVAAAADPHYRQPSFAEPGDSLSCILSECHYVAEFLSYADGGERTVEDYQELDQEGYIHHGRLAIIKGLANTLNAATDLAQELERSYEKTTQSREEVQS
ncbi:MAG: hypothetical protein U5J62_06430 [Desulfurivibrio sp.]|nr:hypothetical protein [Desulfurivibrio sp.]